MNPLNFYKRAVERMCYKSVTQWLKNDDNFLCGLEIKDSHLDVYLFFAGSDKLIYFVFFNKQLLFYGDDFKPAPKYEYDTLECVVSLLSFITLQKGDVDQDYFNNYTGIQNLWSKSMYCDNLKLYCNSLLNYDDVDADHIEAKNYFQNWFIN